MRSIRSVGTAVAVIGALGGCRQIIGYEDPTVIDGGLDAAQCADGKKDGSETDTDCGGSTCAPCRDGKGCGNGADCASKVCSTGTCLAPACGDKVKNGSETDADCGGATCPACGPGKSCAGDGDCAGSSCKAHVCAVTCTDMAKNGYFYSGLCRRYKPQGQCS